jgi:molecular chaperone GrpE
MQQEPEEDKINNMQEETGKVEEADALKQTLAEEKAKAEANLAGWQRAQADFMNYKRRSEQEKEEMAKFANTTLLLNLLPVLDDLERAFAAIPPDLAEADWVVGIRLIERKLWAVLELQGLSQIKALGEPFDPRLHEALRQEKGKDGIVVEEIQKGYKFHDRVIRPSKVAVGNGEEDKKEE